MGETQVGAQMWTNFIYLKDYLLLPLYIVIIFLIYFRVRNAKYPPGHPWRNYFLLGVSLKMAGALFVGMVYQYYYSGGDTSAFFYHANVINKSLSESFVKWINLVLRIPEYYDGRYYFYTSQMMWYDSVSAYLVSVITAIVNIFTFNTFLPTSVVFAALSFTGNWALFKTFAKQYPHISRNIAIATLFIPSTIVWGSGIFKDTICMFALGWLTYLVFEIAVEKKIKLGNVLFIFFCLYLLFVIKVYILIAYVPALLLWVLFTYSHRVVNDTLRNLLKLSVASAALFGIVLTMNIFSKELGNYSLENLSETSNVTRTYIYTVSERDEGSSYDLGSIDPNLGGLALKIPAAVNVTLFRPYIWEAKKPIVMLNAIEAFLFMFFSIKVLFTVGIPRTIISIRKDANIQFFLIFTLIFAFAVGISSYNFGTLSRYRIPCLPFYTLAMVLIYYDNFPAKNRLFSFLPNR